METFIFGTEIEKTYEILNNTSFIEIAVQQSLCAF